MSTKIIDGSKYHWSDVDGIWYRTVFPYNNHSYYQIYDLEIAKVPVRARWKIEHDKGAILQEVDEEGNLTGRELIRAGIPYGEVWHRFIIMVIGDAIPAGLI